MTKPPWSHRLEAMLAAAGLGLLKTLPPALASNLAGGIARGIGPRIPVSKTADRNLAAALPALGPADRRRVIAQVWENLGRTIAEFANISKLRETETGPGFRISGWAHVARALETGGRFIILTGHIGNWEVLPAAFAGRGVELGFMYRAATNTLVDRMIQDLRAENSSRPAIMFAKGPAGARAAYAHLARNGQLVILNDQKLDNGIAVPFFGRDAMTATALASFALRFRCPILPVHVVREAPARLNLIIEAPMDLPDSGDRDADIRTLTAESNLVLERWIREIPGSWLWLHRRWPK